MGRINGVFKYFMLLIFISLGLLLIQPGEASPSDQAGFLNPQRMEFAGITTGHEYQGDLLIAQKTDEESPQSSGSKEEKDLNNDATPKEDFPEDEFPGDDFPDEELPFDEHVGVKDPLEPVNRAFFQFNDKLYFWLLKPMAVGYSAVAPEPVRIGINNFFYNLVFPVRFVNCLLQGKGQGASDEVVRFFINSTVGLAGFIDVATNKLEIKKNEVDLGLTFGRWGMGPGFYINWPILGPATLRDTVGFVGDAFLYPISYIVDPTKYTFALNAFNMVNQTSLRIGDYEDLKKAAFDPYIALRDAYYQNRKSKLEEEH
jgi:phospholipid-binding lipoprotein MlaA